MAERIIVNYGVYQFEESELKAYRLRVLTTVIRQPSNKYESLKPQKPQSFYGYAQLMNGDFVHLQIPIEFVNQCIFEYTAHDNLITSYIAAEQYGTLLTISNANVSQGFPPLTLVEPTIPLYPMAFDRIVFKLHGNTTLAVNTDVVPLPVFENTVPDWDEASGQPLSGSDTVPTANPLDPPYDVPTPPYDDATDDNGETYSPDVAEPPLTGDTGTYRFTITCEYITNIETLATAQITQQYDIPAPVSRPVKTVTVDTSSSYAIAARNTYSPANTVADWNVASYAGSLTGTQKQALFDGYKIISYTATLL